MGVRSAFRGGGGGAGAGLRRVVRGAADAPQRDGREPRSPGLERREGRPLLRRRAHARRRRRRHLCPAPRPRPRPRDRRYGQNAQSLYGRYRFVERGAGTPLGNLDALWTLGDRDALLWVGCTPPPCEYFSWRSYLKGYKTFDIMGSLGDSANNLRFNSTGGSTSPDNFDSTAAVATTRAEIKMQSSPRGPTVDFGAGDDGRPRDERRRRRRAGRRRPAADRRRRGFDAAVVAAHEPRAPARRVVSHVVCWPRGSSNGGSRRRRRRRADIPRETSRGGAAAGNVP